MEKYGTDILQNLIHEETNLMRKISSVMTSGDKTAASANMAYLERELQSVRNRITEIQLEKTEQ